MQVTFVYAQEEPITKTPYYININNTPIDNIVDIEEHVMSLEYNDRYGQWKNIALKIYNWKREKIAGMSLAKVYGVNYYNIKLTDLYGGWTINEIYTCELTDESGKKYEIAIRPINSTKKEDPNVAIVVNPLRLQCDGVTPASVEFVGDISGGKTPYTIQWAVLNNARTALLYQPLEELIKEAGKTSAITVDKSPDYYVLLEVKDACGSIVRREVHLVCDPLLKKINTVFVEPIILPPTGN